MKKFAKRILCAAGLSLAAAAPALAGGPIAQCESGTPFTWGAGGAGIPFNPDQGDLGPVAAADAVNLIETAFQAWEDVPTSSATYTNAGLLPVDVDITNFGPFLMPMAPDGLSAIVFDDTGEIFDLLFGPGTGILGFAGPEFVIPATCTIIEGLSFLNGPSFDDLTAALDVSVHEFGHYSGLGHTDVNGEIFLGGVADTSGPTPDNGTFGLPTTITVIETMYPFYFGPGSGTQTVELDDAASLSSLYPDASFATDTGSISGTVFAPDGTTPLLGVNVIARNVADPFEDASSAITGDFAGTGDGSDPLTGAFTIEGLTPGADYLLFVDEISAGGFSLPDPVDDPLSPLPGPEEFWNAGDSDGISSPDDPLVGTPITIVAGADASGTDVIFNTPVAPGVPLPLGDDDSIEVFMPFSFNIGGESFASVFINSNGSLTFGGGDTDFSESAGEFLAGLPRIAGLWDDLSPNNGGQVFFTQTANTFEVNWLGVPEFPAVGSNTFSITLYAGPQGKFEISGGSISAPDGITGVSLGGSQTSGFEESVDLTQLATNRRRGRRGGRGGSRVINSRANPATFEVFDGIANIVDINTTTLNFNGTREFDEVRFEPNNELTDAANVRLPFNTLGVNRYTEIEPEGGDVDWYRFHGKAGTTVIAEVLTSQLDTVMGLFTRFGPIVAFDDDGGTGLLSRIEFVVPEDGTFFLAVSTFGDADFDGVGGSGEGRYVLDIQEINGVVLPLGDDTSQEVALGFPFPFQGTDYTSVFVNSNGNLTFGSGDSDFSESVAEFLSDQPRIAPLWDDLSPNQGGAVFAGNDASGFTVTFSGVPEFFATTSNSFSVTLSPDGSISVDYGAIAALDGLAGITPGGGAADPGESDLSDDGPFSANGTTYEFFTFGENDLSGADVDYNP
ncbi:MAG: hypothetical protein AAGD92_01160 [Pseudomonadota bacterium]